MADDVGIAQEFINTEVDLNTATTQILYRGPCVVRATYVNTVMNAFAANLVDAAGVNKFTIPASSPVGAPFTHFDSTQDGLTVTSNASGTGEIAIIWKPFTEAYDPIPS